jgi:hypothetical protein
MFSNKKKLFLIHIFKKIITTHIYNKILKIIKNY